MRVLIVQSAVQRAESWSVYLGGAKARVSVARDRTMAVAALRAHRFDVIVLDLGLADGMGLMIADYASYRQPWAKLVFLTEGAGFSDGQLLRDYANARGVAQPDVPPDDLAAMVDYYASCA